MSNGSKPEVVVITGATAGVGRATARAFARRGARIGLLARGSEGLAATKQDVERLGGQALELPTDVADYDQVEAAAQAVEDEFGPIDIWVNNAMTSVFAQFWDIGPEEYRRVTDVVYHGQMHGLHVALQRMRPRDRGTVILVGSALAYRGIPLQSAYCGGKHAIQGMFESVRTELMHEGSHVKLSTVHLPAMNTPQFNWVRSKLPKKAQPVPPIYQPEVAADAIVYASENDRRAIWVGAPTVKTVVGNRVSGAGADWYLARSGYGSQQRDEPEDPDRADNLWEPVEGDHGAHGVFDSQARTVSPELWASKHRGWVAAGAGVLAGLLGAMLAVRD